MLRHTFIMTPNLWMRRALLLVVLICGSAISGRAAEPPAGGGALPVPLPDPLIDAEGRKITTAEGWKRRREELKRQFQDLMYGAIPPVPARVRHDVSVVDRAFLGGKATLKLVKITFEESGAPEIQLMLVVPNGGAGRSPVFLAMNFCGNHAIHSDPRIPLTRGWLYNSCKGCTNGQATEASRGSQQADWPLEEIVGRGYALAAFASTDIDSDRGDVSDGVYAWLAGRAGRENRPQDRGTISGWAWGFHRCVDYLVKDRDIDSRRIAIVGHSRNGKTALLAAAMDDRIALSIPHQAGCGGTAPSRGRIGESVKQINDRFPHWFNGAFKRFNDDPSRLPFDQNGLVALVAPRPVLLSNAEEDQWANPSGQFEVLRGAEGVYRLMGGGGLDAGVMPPSGQLVRSRLGYYIRPGKHSMTSGDWRIFMEFADHHLKGSRAR